MYVKQIACFAYSRKSLGRCAVYETLYLGLLRSRAAERQMQRELFDGAGLLCSEATPEHCHRRLLAEYLSEQWGGIRIVHL